MGASLLVFKNKSDVKGSMTVDEVQKVWAQPFSQIFSANMDFLRHWNLTKSRPMHGQSLVAVL
jgi:hypothetical protein